MFSSPRARLNVYWQWFDRALSTIRWIFKATKPVVGQKKDFFPVMKSSNGAFYASTMRFVAFVRDSLYGTIGNWFAWDFAKLSPDRFWRSIKAALQEEKLLNLDKWKQLKEIAGAKAILIVFFCAKDFLLFKFLSSSSQPLRIRKSHKTCAILFRSSTTLLLTIFIKNNRKKG